MTAKSVLGGPYSRLRADSRFFFGSHQARDLKMRPEFNLECIQDIPLTSEGGQPEQF